jgi:transcriptional regulator with XRE-family HTH domain
MPTEEVAICELWELAPPAIPPRSRLYPLEPIGVGTSGVESLTGYLARLAEAHGVHLRRLLLAEILPLLGRSHLLGPENRGLSAFWQRETRALNGTRTLARDLVRAVERLTLRHDLRFLTLLPWADVLPPRDLLRPDQAWCPACYEEWRQAGQVVYEPLLWSLSVVSACPRHQRRLQALCPYPDCRRRRPPLARHARPGHCPWCDRWLGREQEPAAGAWLSDRELRWQSWVTEAIGELLAAAPGLSAPLEREAVARAINRQVRQVTDGNATALAKRLGVEMVTLAGWRRGRAIPCLGLLLRTCYCLGTRPLGFLLDDAPGTAVIGGDLAVLPESHRRPSADRRPFAAAQMRGLLEAVLASDEAPPPPMREIARRVGVSHSFLLLQLPELCRAISARYLAHQREQSARKRQRLCAEIRQAVAEVQSSGFYPSANRIAPLLSQSGFIRDHQARIAWQEALRELGWRA